MCMVSMVSEPFATKWEPYTVFPNTTQIPGYPYKYGTISFDHVPRAEFDALRNEVRELKDLLIAAKRFDERTGQPDCEDDSKVAILRKVAEAVGVDLDEVFGAKT